MSSDKSLPKASTFKLEKSLHRSLSCLQNRAEALPFGSSKIGQEQNMRTNDVADRKCSNVTYEMEESLTSPQLEITGSSQVRTCHRVSEGRLGGWPMSFCFASPPYHSDS